MKAAQLLELVVARQQGAENPAIQQLLTRLRDGSGTGTNMQDMLAHFAQTNPLLGLLAQRRGVAGAEVLDAVTVDGEPGTAESSGHTGVTARDESDASAAHSDQSWADLSLYRERVDRCAAALGACGLCWGAEPACRACRGRGRPGFSLPDESLFQELVLPAVRMMRTHRAGTIAVLRPADASIKETSLVAEVTHPSN
jgi:hypothetical protein